jgi:N-acyl-D-amino-acid deacylase
MNRIQKILPTWVAVAIACMMPAIGSPQDSKAEPEYDIVIRGGRVLDGAGNPCIFADVAIKYGRFVKIGKVYGSGRTEIDARGRYVSPG